MGGMTSSKNADSLQKTFGCGASTPYHHQLKYKIFPNYCDKSYGLIKNHFKCMIQVEVNQKQDLLQLEWGVFGSRGSLCQGGLEK